MNAQQELIPGTNRDLSKSQYFTPPELAERVVEWCDLTDWTVPGQTPHRYRVLEPSAGNGALVRPLVAAGAEVYAVEIDERYCDALDLLNPRHIECADFLTLAEGPGRFDLCVMNPPYEHGQDVAFVLHALKFAPRVVGIFRSQILHGKARKRDLWAHVRPTRIAYLSERPDFGGDYGAMTDFVVLELVERTRHSRSSATGFAEATLEFW